LTSCADSLADYDRSLEKEADMKSVDYIINAKINPIPFADFLSKIDQRKKSNKFEGWFSIHPDSKERSEYIKTYSKKKGGTYKPVLSTESWEYLTQ